MTTDIILDDVDGNTVTLSCQALSTSAADVLVDNPASRKTSGGARHALRHLATDTLSINPARDYPGGVSIQDADLNLRVHSRTLHGPLPVPAPPPALPKRARPGDLFLLDTVIEMPARSDVPRHVIENVTLWLCVGREPTGAARWAPITMGAPVSGTV